MLLSACLHLPLQAATRYCVVHVDTPVETCRQWNAERQGPSYESAVLEDLCGRCEWAPSGQAGQVGLYFLQPCCLCSGCAAGAIVRQKGLVPLEQMFQLALMLALPP